MTLSPKVIALIGLYIKLSGVRARASTLEAKIKERFDKLESAEKKQYTAQVEAFTKEDK